MKDWQGKRYWLIGASEGLGAALARVMSRSGVELVLSARNGDRLQEVADSLPGRVTIQPLDVTDAASVEAAADKVGEVDGVVHLAGTYWPVKAGDWNAERVAAMAEVNLVGALRVTGAVVPRMIERDKGHIVLTGALAGYRGLPRSIGFSASKAGVMNLAECLHADLRKTGVQVQLVNPGFVRTRLSDRDTESDAGLMDPERAARLMFEHMGGESFSRSFPGTVALLRRAAQFLPDAIYYRLFS